MNRPFIYNWTQKIAAAAAIFSSCAYAAPVVMPIQPQHVISADSITSLLQVPATPGQVISGKLTGLTSQLFLVDSQGKKLRRLGNGYSQIQPFMFVVPASGALLKIENPAADNTVEITQIYSTQPYPAQENDHTPVISPKLQQVQQDIKHGQDTTAFWRDIQQQGSPLIEPVDQQTSLVTFLWRGAQHNVRLFGAPSGNHESLHRLGQSDIWWASFTVNNQAMMSYQLAPDVPLIQGTDTERRHAILATAQRDPYNPHQFPDTDNPDVYQGSSALMLPQAAMTPWIKNKQMTSGTLNETQWHSRQLNNTRKVWVYMPETKPERLLVMFDGAQYLHKINTKTILDNLIHEHRIPPTAAILIDHIDQNTRSDELPPNPLFADALTTELMPQISQQYRFDIPASQTVIAGSSYGGLASVYMARRHPDIFGNVLSMSGSFWWSPERELPNWMSRQFAVMPVSSIRFYLDAGRFESYHRGMEGILETNRTLGYVLKAKGYQVTQREHFTGHDYLHWQNALSCGLIDLLGTGIQQLTVCNGIDDMNFSSDISSLFKQLP